LKSNTIYNSTDVRPVGTDLLSTADGRTNGRTEKHGEYKCHLWQNCDNATKKRISTLSGNWSLPSKHYT